MPQEILPPSNAGPAGQEAAKSLCRFPTINSVLVPMSMMAMSRSSSHIHRQHARGGVGTDVTADDGHAISARFGMQRQQQFVAGSARLVVVRWPSAISSSVLER